MNKAKKGVIVLSISLLIGLSIWQGIPIVYKFITPYVKPVPKEGSCYAFEGFSWKSTPATIWINETSAPKDVNWDFDIQTAVQQYDQIHSNLFAITTSYSLAKVTIGWGHLAANGTELGLSTIYSFGTTETSAAVTLDLGTTNWTDMGSNPQLFYSGAYSVEHVLLHELGHVAGLAHSSCVSEVMYPVSKVGNTGNSLGIWDTAGVKAIYQ